MSKQATRYLDPEKYKFVWVTPYGRPVPLAFRTFGQAMKGRDITFYQHVWAVVGHTILNTPILTPGRSPEALYYIVSELPWGVEPGTLWS